MSSINYSKSSRRIQEKLLRYLNPLLLGLNKTDQRFIKEASYGILKKEDIKLSSIVKSLDEDIKPESTENRLSRKIRTKDYTEFITKKLLELSKGKIRDDTVMAIDLSDITKKYSESQEYLAKVYDGSEDKVSKGYWLLKIIGIEEEKIIPLLFMLYSLESTEFMSENDVILKSLEKLRSHLGNKGIKVIDRGGDRKVLFNYFLNSDARFIIRMKDNRNLISCKKNQKRSINSMLDGIRFKHAFTITYFDKKKRKDLTKIFRCSLFKVKLPWRKEKLTLLIGKFKRSSKYIMLLTNLQEENNSTSAHYILKCYLDRHKIEDCFRYYKTEYNIEDVRLLRYRGLKNIISIFQLVLYFIFQELRIKALGKYFIDVISNIIKRFKKKKNKFIYYGVSEYISKVLNKSSMIDFYIKNKSDPEPVLPCMKEVV
jgi:hypothetical protein